jgi:hypothetical protein
MLSVGQTLNKADSKIPTIKYEKGRKTFSFLNHVGDIVGSFSVPQLIKYLTESESSEFIQRIDQETYRESSRIIEQYLLRKETNRIVLLANTESPFMGDVEMLIRLNKALYNFEQNELHERLEKIESEKIRRRVTLILKRTFYLLLSHTLRVIFIATDAVRNDLGKMELKDHFINYSIGIVYRLAQYVQDQITLHLIHLADLHRCIKACDITRAKVGQKLEDLDLRLKALELKQTGGHKSSRDDSSSDESDKSSESSKSDSNYRTDSDSPSDDIVISSISQHAEIYRE